jgi:hypothetical protein
MRYYPHGLGGASGSDISNSYQAITSRPVVYVHSSGTTGNNGLTRSRPYASLDAAFTGNAANGQVYVMLPGHTDSSACTTSYSGITICGEGEGVSRPTFIGGSLSITQPGVLVDNIRFSSGAFMSSVSTNNTGLLVRNCYFQASVGTQAFTFDSNTRSYGSVDNCEFEQSPAANNAIAMYATSAEGGFVAKNCTFRISDSYTGTDQWLTYAAVVGCSNVKLQGNRMSDGCGAKVYATSAQIFDGAGARGGWYEI